MNDQTMHTLENPSRFPTTRWTLVVAAGHPQQKEASSALASLCENYWYPLYAYLRRCGYPAEQAQDFTQEFFVRVLEGRYLDRADPAKGRFRSFILTSLKFFVADEEDRHRAHKVAAAQSSRWNSRRARSATNTSLRTMRRPSVSLNGAGRFRCWTASSRNCERSSCNTGVRSISSD